MDLSSKFNVLHCDLACPYCKQKIITEIGFQVGFIANFHYKIGDTLSWTGQTIRPNPRPAKGNIVTLGHFNCDNPHCSSWQDCYPTIQNAKISIEKDKIVAVSVYDESPILEQFAILSQS